MDQLFPSGGQILELQLQSFSEYSGLISFRINWFDLPCCPRDSQESSPAPRFKSINSSVLSLLHSPSIHDDWKKIIALTIRTFVGKVISLLFNTLSRFVIAFYDNEIKRQSKDLLISWLQSPSAVILEPPTPHKRACHCFHGFSIYLP